MKILNKETAKEIGFDIDCLPKWVNWIIKRKCGRVYAYDLKPVIIRHGEVYNHYQGEFIKLNPNLISEYYKKLHFEESLLKIER